MLDLSKPHHVHVDQRLRSDLIIWLTTVRADGRPHIAAVWFLWDGQTFLLFSMPNQKVRNLRHNHNVMLALDDTKGGGDVITVEGTAELVDDPAITATLPAYASKYQQKLQAMGESPDRFAKGYSQAIRITPTRLRTVQ